MEKTINFLGLNIRYMDVLNTADLYRVKGGNENEEEEYGIVYIDGKPYRVKKNSTGQIIEILPM